MSTVKIGLMGFGEIGRDLYQLMLFEPDMEVVAISDLGRADVLYYLLQSDGRLPENVRLESNFLISDTQRARILHGVEPGDVPWDAFDVDIVIDSTHKYLNRDTLQDHLEAGARRVILSGLMMSLTISSSSASTKNPRRPATGSYRPRRRRPALPRSCSKSSTARLASSMP